MKILEMFIGSAIGAIAGNIVFYGCRELWHRYKDWKFEQSEFDRDEPFWEDPERMCEWPECDRHAEYSCCYCNRHMRVDAAGFPIYHEGKILPTKPVTVEKPEPPKIKIIRDGQ